MLAIYITRTVRRMRCAVCNINFPKKWRDIRSSIKVMFRAFPDVIKVGEHLSISNSRVCRYQANSQLKQQKLTNIFSVVLQKKRKIRGIESSDNNPLNVRCYEVLTESFESKLCCVDHFCLTMTVVMKGNNMSNYLYSLLCNRWSE